MLDLLIGLIVNFLDTRHYPLKNEINKDQENFYHAVLYCTSTSEFGLFRTFLTFVNQTYFINGRYRAELQIIAIN